MSLIIRNSFKKSADQENKRNKSYFNRVLAIESRNCSNIRKSSFLAHKKKLTKNDAEIPKKKESSMTPERIKSLISDLAKAETYLKEAKTYSKFRILKERIEPINEPVSDVPAKTSYKKIKGKFIMTPIKIPRSGLNIKPFYNYD